MKTRRRTKRGGGDDVPVSSFSDIAFLLIIFFILTTTLAKSAGFLTDLPSGEDSQQESEEGTTVKLNGATIVLNDKAVSIEELQAELEAMHLEERTGDAKIVLLEATGSVQYQNYFDVMASISSAGGAIGIIREEDEEE